MFMHAISSSHLRSRLSRISFAATAIMLLATSGHALDRLDFAVSGTDPGLTERVEGASLLRAAVAEDRVSPADLLATARAEYRALTGALYGAGYYGALIQVLVDGREAASLSPLDAPARIGVITVRIDPGPQFRFGTASVTPAAEGTEFPDEFRAGAIADSNLIGAAARAGIEGWRAAGHAKADLAGQSITADHARKTVDARLQLDPGPKLRFGPLQVSGNTRVRTDRIVEIAGLPTGEVFTPQASEKSAARLRRTGAFRSVAFSEGDAIGGETLAMGVAVVEEKRRRLGFGADLSSEEGLTLSGFWMHRNLLGGAERLRTDFEIAQIGGISGSTGAESFDSGIDVTLSFRFQRPATFTPDTDLYVTGELARIDDPGYLSRSLTFATGVTHIVSDTITAEAGLKFRTSRVTDAIGTGDFTIFSIPLRVARDTRDKALDARDGTFADLTVEPFVGISGTDSGARLTFDGRAYQPFGERLVLAARAQVGAIWGPELNRTPPDMLFFAGGGGSVRGQPYQSLGVTTGSATTGGRSYLALAGEVRAQVTKSIGVVGFIDTAYIGTESFYDGSGNWMTGAGLGLRYSTPIGPIRFDLATPVDGGPADASSVQIYIGIGQAF
jgi:translocation and assembly module TamA